MPQRNSLPIIALTQGDPAGIGPELCLKVIREPRVLEVCQPVIIGDLNVLRQVGERLSLAMPDEIFSPDNFQHVRSPALIDCRILNREIDPGISTREAGAASYRYIELAASLALEKRIDGIATAPITKSTLAMAGIEEPGHTEILARLTRCDNFAMMLYSGRIVVSLVTIHQSLTSVSGDLKTGEIVRVTQLTAETMRRIRGREPRLAILGLNPHAGEDGMFGREEIDIITPAVQAARRAGINVEGPLSPDAAFMPHNLARFDAHVCMYHDQGLIPFKMVSLHDGVNITMGLPIVRTSVDHGTAYNIAWQGKAEITSFVSAIELAARMVATQ